MLNLDRPVFMPDDDLLLPPILEACVLKALSQGKLFSQSCSYPNLLPIPNFPAKRKSMFLEDFSSDSCDSLTYTVCGESSSSQHEHENVISVNQRHQAYLSNQLDFSLNSFHERNFQGRESINIAPSLQKYCANPASKRARRIILTAALAKEIYSIRPLIKAKCGEKLAISETARSREVAQKYDISGKTVRDIWHRITWTEATQSLWTTQELRGYIASRMASDTRLLHSSSHGSALHQPYKSACAYPSEPENGPEQAEALAVAVSLDPSTLRRLRRPPGRPRGARGVHSRHSRPLGPTAIAPSGAIPCSELAAPKLLS